MKESINASDLLQLRNFLLTSYSKAHVRDHLLLICMVVTSVVSTVKLSNTESQIIFNDPFTAQMRDKIIFMCSSQILHNLQHQ